MGKERRMGRRAMRVSGRSFDFDWVGVMGNPSSGTGLDGRSVRCYFCCGEVNHGFLESRLLHWYWKAT